MASFAKEPGIRRRCVFLPANRAGWQRFVSGIAGMLLFTVCAHLSAQSNVLNGASVPIQSESQGQLMAGSGFNTKSTPAYTRTAYTAAIDPSRVVVTNFEGWGTSLCWWASVCGGYSNRSNYAALAFSTLKLNIVRYNIGGGENPNLDNTIPFRARIQGFEPNNGVWNWNADANQRWMLKQAVALGANRVVAFANSPPWWMTVSGSATGAVGGGNNLRTDCETNFASYLATVISQLTVRDGAHFDFVTPVNEPSSSWWTYGGRQEGCHMDAGQQARLANDLRAALDERNITAGVDASEDNDEQSAVNSLNAYGSAQTNVALIATHTYTANAPAELADLAASWHKPLWVSEYGDGDATGITMARRIHDDITGARACAWIYWQVVDSARSWGFLRNPLNADGDTDFTVNQKFYVMGQFSQYIRPGCQIIHVSDANTLAAYDPAGHRLILVGINDSMRHLEVNYDLNGFISVPASASVVRTSGLESASTLPPLPISNKILAVTLKPQSVTTMILDNVAPATAPGVQ